MHAQHLNKPVAQINNFFVTTGNYIDLNETENKNVTSPNFDIEAHAKPIINQVARLEVQAIDDESSRIDENITTISLSQTNTNNEYPSFSSYMYQLRIYYIFYFLLFMFCLIFMAKATPNVFR